MILEESFRTVSSINFINKIQRILIIKIKLIKVFKFISKKFVLFKKSSRRTWIIIIIEDFSKKRRLCMLKIVNQINTERIKAGNSLGDNLKSIVHVVRHNNTKVGIKKL